jgi:hypothetical protein
VVAQATMARPLRTMARIALEFVLGSLGLQRPDPTSQGAHCRAEPGCGGRPVAGGLAAEPGGTSAAAARPWPDAQ